MTSKNILNQNSNKLHKKNVINKTHKKYNFLADLSLILIPTKNSLENLINKVISLKLKPQLPKIPHILITINFLLQKLH